MEQGRLEAKGVSSLLTPEQVSELSNLKVRQVTELARQGRIPAIKLGRLWRFPEDALRAWIEESQARIPHVGYNNYKARNTKTGYKVS